MDSVIINVTCESCESQFELGPKWHGRRICCSECGFPIQVPGERRSEYDGAFEGDKAQSVQATAELSETLKDRYAQRSKSLKARIGRFKEKSQEFITGKKGYQVGEATQEVLSQAPSTADVLAALEQTLEVEYQVTGQVNPVKRSLVEGYLVDPYGLCFAGDMLVQHRKKPARGKKGYIQLRLAAPIPGADELAQRYRGLDRKIQVIDIALRALEPDEGNVIRLRFATRELEADTRAYRIIQVGFDADSASHLYTLQPE